MSSTVRIPPPTVSGMNTCSAVRRTTSSMMSRPSWLAVMSRNTSSSAPSRLVPRGHFHGIAGVAQVQKVDALDHAAAVDIKARDDAFGEHGGECSESGLARSVTTGRKVAEIARSPLNSLV